jgi:hypothetical protein
MGFQYVVVLACGLLITGFYKRFRWSLLKTKKITYTK